MMNVRVVRMRMFKPLVAMPMPVRFARGIARSMFMLVMLIVRVFMLARH